MEAEPGESSWGQGSVLTEATEEVCVRFWRVRFFCYKLEACICKLNRGLHALLRELSGYDTGWVKA